MFAENPHGYPTWSLRRDAALRGETIAALHANNVTISIGEGFLQWPHAQVSDYVSDLDLMRELGAQRINLESLDPDLNHAFDQCAKFAEMASTRGLVTVLEYLPIPGLAISDLSTAVRAIRHAANKNFAIAVDTMHFFRSGSTPSDLAAVDPAVIGYIQLCDIPLVAKYDDYAYEARFDRLAPGEGELPLFDFLTAAPRDVIVGLEVPMLRKAEAGIGPKARLSEGLKTTREMLTRIDASDRSRGSNPQPPIRTFRA